jgi:hypothetical protein
MGVRDKLRRLEKAAQGKLAHFELSSGQRYYFDQQEVFQTTFRFFVDSALADYRREPRPEPPEVLRAAADARNRAEALSLVMDGGTHLPIDPEALVERGEFVPRSLVAGREYGDFEGLGDLSE